MSIPVMLCILVAYILNREFAHGQLNHFSGHTGNSFCTTLEHIQEETAVYFKFTFVGAKDTTIDVTMGRNVDIPCMEITDSLIIYMTESSANENLSCVGSYHVTYSFKGLGQKLDDQSKSESAPFFCIDWHINPVEGRFNSTRFDIYYSGDNRESSSSTMDTKPSYNAEIKVPSSKHVQLSQVLLKNVITDGCKVFLNSTDGNMKLVPTDFQSVRIVSKPEDAVKGENVMNNTMIDKKFCIRFAKIPTHTSDVAENAPLIFRMFVLCIVVVILICLLVAVRSRSCTYVTSHGKCLPEVPAWV